MLSDDLVLSVKERAVLLALLVESGELTNRDLEERVGFRLDGKERRNLNDNGLVTSRRPGRAYLHKLSADGIEWCRRQASVGPPQDAGSIERALYALLGGIRRYLGRSDGSKARTLDEMFTSMPAAEDVAARIRSAYDHAAVDGSGTFVRLAVLRAGLSGLTRSSVDTTLEALYESRIVNLIPLSDTATLNDDDLASAITVGDEDKHRIAFQKS
ncbi:MAG: hypothetical protein QOH97_974 [Actinoplanes sp.]|jgi:DNA-binding transcriptional ArsR family regulator|nr:hypothetical protein [Actinoplanes sp.]